MGDPGSARRDPLTQAPLLALATGLLVAGVVATWQARRTWFFGDEWAFLLDPGPVWRHVLEPHNEHWSTLPRLVYWVTVSTFGTEHHLPYAVLPVLLHLGVCVCLYVLLRRHGVSAWAAVITTLLLGFLCGDVAENPLWPFQIGFLGSALFGLVALLLADARPTGWRGTSAAWLAGILALMCSGMAVPMLGFGALALVLTRGLPVAVRFASLPAAVYLAWFLTAGHDGVAQAPSAGVGDILDFAYTGLASLWQQVLRTPGWGGVLLVALTAAALLVPASPRARRLAISGVLAAVATYLLLGVTRAGLGPDTALAGRYSYFGILFTLPALAVVVDAVIAWLAGRHLPLAARVLLVSVPVAVLAMSGAAQTVAYTDARIQLSPGLEERILGAQQLLRDGAPLLGRQVEPNYNPDITVEALTLSELTDRLPTGRPSPRGLLDAALGLQVAASATAFSLPVATSIELRNVQGEVPEQGCAELLAGDGARLEIAPSHAGNQVQLTIRRKHLDLRLADGTVVSHPRRVRVEPGLPVNVGNVSTAPLQVAMARGRFQPCR